MIKKALPAVLAATVLGGVSATAQAMEISGNVALTSDYRFRGISQSDESIAIQGGFDLGFENGIYLGTWGSSVDFDTNGDGFDGSLELDYYAGWAGSISDNIGIDVGILNYDNPGDDDAEGEYLEFYGSVSMWDVSLGLAYSDDYYGETGEFFYYSADTSLGLTENLSLDLQAGNNDLDEEGF
ncbi:hypothetical protein E4634_21375, partial [Mangrovimicrobium sediminis]